MVNSTVSLILTLIALLFDLVVRLVEHKLILREVAWDQEVELCGAVLVKTLLFVDERLKFLVFHQGHDEWYLSQVGLLLETK